MRFVATALLTIFSVFLVSQGAFGQTSSAPATAPAPANGQIDVVLFLIDTLRADAVGTYGCPKPTTPNIDALAAEGVVFENAYTPSAWTLPTIPSLFTSTYNCEHGVIANGNRLSPNLITLAERFQKLDYETANFYTNNFAGPLTNLHRGFDECRKVNFVDGKLIQEWREATGAEGRDARPFFLYAHNLEPHNAFNAPPRLVKQFGQVPIRQQQRIGKLHEDYRAMMRNRADAESGDQTARTERLIKITDELDSYGPANRVLYEAVTNLADQRVGSVIQTLKQLGRWENTLFIVVADHGEEFGEHGGFQHSQSVYEELVRIPMVMRFPRNAHAGTRVKGIANLVDVLPTIFDVLGKPTSAAGARGRSLLPLIASPKAHDGLRVVSVRQNTNRYFRVWDESRGNLNVALREGDWKGIWNADKDAFELYNLAKDRGERVNQADAQPEIVGRMKVAAKQWLDDCRSKVQDAGEASLEGVDRETMRDLAAQGYVDMPSEDDSADTGPRKRAQSRPTTKPSSRPASQPKKP